MRHLPTMGRYGLAILTCGLGQLAAFPLDAPCSCFFLAVAITTLYGGKGPGLLAAAISSLALDYYFIPPRFTFYLEPSSYLRFAAYMAAALLIVFLVEAKRRTEIVLRHTAAKAQKRQQHLREAQSLSHTGSFEWDTATGDMLWSDEMYRIAGCDSSVPPTTALWFDRIHPGDRPRVKSLWTEALPTGADLEFETRFVTPAGDVKNIHVVAHATPIEPGRLCYVGAAMDITNRIRAEEDLRRSEDRLRQTIHSIPTLVWSTCPKGNADFFNQPWLEFTGFTPAQARGWGWTAAVHPGDRANLVESWQSMLSTGVPVEVEARLRCREGSYRWFLFRGNALRDESGKLVKWYCTNADIEDRKTAEQNLRARERELSLIIETIPALVWCAAPNGDLTYVNQRVLDYTGVTTTDMARSDWLNFLHSDDVQPTIAAWSKAVATGCAHEVQYRLRRADGEYRWFHVVGQPARDCKGRISRWYGLLLDVHDRKTVEEALRYTQTRLSRATQVATVGELAASIAHEINQPLAAVVANGQACLRWLSAAPPNLLKAQEAAERIARDGKEAGEVVRRIRALFKRAAPEKAALDLNDVIAEVLRLLGGEASRRRITVETILEDHLPPIFGDRIHLQQLLLNLLLNGMEAMDGVADRPRRLRIQSAMESPDAVRVEIRDCGSGLVDSERVFDAFFTTKDNGLGMGLAICRSIIDAHHGRLWASSPPDGGTSFSFTLPIHSCVTS